ncbi:MAG: sugar nucleotide-binding protein [Ignavibacteriaceae bacterium]|nr:sugar nucleotide-binding protein [Ignavibacteriaceae bacterium]
MKALITGAGGTLGGAMLKLLAETGDEAVCWDRSKTSPFVYEEMKNFVEKVKPDVLFHFAIASESTGAENESWRINYDWPGELAWLTAQLNIKFVFTSTVMVFTDSATGPFTTNSVPDARSGYGFEKLRAEERVRSQNSRAYIMRLGWQIGDEFTGNNMIAHFEREQTAQGFVKGSSLWCPACSFTGDTVREIYRLINEMPPALYMIDSNNGYDFHRIASALSRSYNNRWKIELDDSFVYDQRMRDPNTRIPKLSDKLFF